MRTNNWIILEQIKTIKRASEIIKKLALKEKDYSLHFASLETERYMQNILDKYEAKVNKEKLNIETHKKEEYEEAKIEILYPQKEEEK